MDIAMRCCLILVALVAVAAAVPQTHTLRAANKDLVKKQQDVILLLQQMLQKIPNDELLLIGKNYDILNNLQKYKDPNVVKNLVLLLKKRYVQPKYTTFNPSSNELRKQVKLLERILLGAKDYSTFLKTAAWARINLNAEQFVKAFVASVLQRKDTQGIILPAPYEVFPNLFFDSKVIQRAQNIQSLGFLDTSRNDNPLLLKTYYDVCTTKDEGRLNYFTQDIGLSAYYAFVGMAGWMQKTVDVEDDNGKKIDRGSQYYYLHQQLLARYNLERLSNKLGPIVEPIWKKTSSTFKPHLRYLNGVEFLGRDFNVDVCPDMRSLVDKVGTLEERLKDAIDSGYIKTSQGGLLSLYQRKGLDILGNLIEGNGRSLNLRYYGNLQGTARHLLGGSCRTINDFDPMPSALELHITALRDPAFYQLYKRIIKIFKQYQDSLPLYQYDDLLLPGVKIESINVDKLVTYFDKFQTNINGATVMSPIKLQRGNLQIKAEMDRLNHKSFDYQIVVQSDKQLDDAVVRVYIGPKFNHDGSLTCIEKDRLLFVELDQFNCRVDVGRNIFKRNSKQAPGRSFDHPSISKILNQVNNAARSENPFYLTEPEKLFGFPERLALPKGLTNGLPLQLLAVISSSQQKEGQLFGPVVPEIFQNYQQLNLKLFDDRLIQDKLDRLLPEDYLGFNVDNLKGGMNRDQDDDLRNLHRSSFQRYFGQNPYPEERTFLKDKQLFNLNDHSLECLDSQNSEECRNILHKKNILNTQDLYGCEDTQTSEECKNYKTLLKLKNKREKLYHGYNQDFQGLNKKLDSLELGTSQESLENVNQRSQEWLNNYKMHLGNTRGNLENTPRNDQQKLQQYFQDKSIQEIIGGAVSLDGRPLGFPLERPLEHGALRVPNVKVIDVLVYHETKDVMDDNKYFIGDLIN